MKTVGEASSNKILVKSVQNCERRIGLKFADPMGPVLRKKNQSH